MQRDPSGGKGRRTATRPTGQTEGRPMDDFERSPITRAGVGGLMVVLAVVVGGLAATPGLRLTTIE